MAFQNSARVYSQGTGTASLPYIVQSTRDPGTNDTNYNITQQWQNTSTQGLFFLNSKTSSNGVTTATWVNLSAGGSLTLSDNTNVTVALSSGSASPPDNIQFTSTDGSISIVSNASNHSINLTTGGGVSWTSISASQTLANNAGYVCAGGGALSLALPAVAAFGSTIAIILNGSTSFTITQGAGQSVRIGANASTVGAGGSVASTATGNAVRLLCTTANTTWTAEVGVQGNLTVV